MRKTTLLLGAVAAFALAEAKPVQAYEGPWCAYMSTGFDFYTSRCDLPTYEACRAEIQATPGTWCTQNPRYRGPVGGPSRSNRKPQPRY